MIDIIELRRRTDSTYETKELTFLAPSGQPARATLIINIKGKYTFDSVSFKKYLTTLRQVSAYQEDISGIIEETLRESFNEYFDIKFFNVEERPYLSINVCVTCNARGGIRAIIR